MARATARTEERTGLRSVLGFAPLYQAAQSMIGADRALRWLVSEVIRPASADRLLDIGCGTATIRRHLSIAEYVGVEPSERYAARASLAVGGSGTIVNEVVEAPGLLDRLGGAFEIVIMIGVLHHLNDDVAESALELAVKAAPGGRLVTIDPVVVEGQSRVARALVQRDRGKYVRRPEAVDALISRFTEDSTLDVRTDLLRFPYTHVVTDSVLPG